MVPPLPFEIWVQIVLHLSNDELGQLLCVNKALYEISMNSRYKTLRARWPDNATVTKLRMLRDTVSVAERVQDLEISYRILEVLWRARSTRFRRLRNQFRCLISLFSRDRAALTSKSIASIERLLVGAVNNMHGLRSVLFNLHPFDGLVERYLPMVVQVWLLLSTRVDSLSICVWAKHASLLRPTFSSILGMKHLSISLRGIYQGEACGLADLINTASESLESLRLEMFLVSTSSLVHRIFNGLHGLSRLRRVDLSFYNTVGCEGVNFLNAHGETIEELELSICPTAGGGTFNIAALHLPRLRKLSVEWNPFNWGGSLNTPFQHFWASADFPMLNCLEITSPFMEARSIAGFCNAFKRPGGNRVQRLQFPCHTLNAEVFDHLWEAFSNLHTLILPTIFLSNPNHEAPDWNIVRLSL
ncbi:hypothetical protein AB1N83_009066 [Pleurotus pulmonarius]